MMPIQLPEHIDVDHWERYILTVRIHPEQFSFDLYDPSDAASRFLYTIGCDKPATAFASFRELFFDNDFFNAPFREVQIINYTPVFTYIPSLIFEEKDKETYLDFLFTERKGKVLFHSIPRQEMTVLHEMPEEVYEFFQRSFVRAQIVHHTAPLVDYFREKDRTVPGNRLIVNLQGSGMDLCCFSRETLLLVNHFRCSGIEDAVYYILFVWKQLKFDRLCDFVHIVESPSSTLLAEALQPYLRQVLAVSW
jgi:hypothetical protein